MHAASSRPATSEITRPNTTISVTFQLEAPSVVSPTPPDFQYRGRVFDTTTVFDRSILRSRDAQRKTEAHTLPPLPCSASYSSLAHWMVDFKSPGVHDSYLNVVKFVLLREVALKGITSLLQRIDDSYWKYAYQKVEAMEKFKSGTSDKLKSMLNTTHRLQVELSTSLAHLRSLNVAVIEAIREWRKQSRKTGAIKDVVSLYWMGENYLIKMKTDVVKALENIPVIWMWLGFTPNNFLLPPRDYNPADSWRQRELRYQEWIKFYNENRRLALEKMRLLTQAVGRPTRIGSTTRSTINAASRTFLASVADPTVEANEVSANLDTLHEEESCNDDEHSVPASPEASPRLLGEKSSAAVQEGVSPIDNNTTVDPVVDAESSGPSQDLLSDITAANNVDDSSSPVIADGSALQRSVLRPGSGSVLIVGRGTRAHLSSAHVSTLGSAGASSEALHDEEVSPKETESHSGGDLSPFQSFGKKRRYADKRQRGQFCGVDSRELCGRKGCEFDASGSQIFVNTERLCEFIRARDSRR